MTFLIVTLIHIPQLCTSIKWCQLVACWTNPSTSFFAAAHTQNPYIQHLLQTPDFLWTGGVIDRCHEAYWSSFPQDSPVKVTFLNTVKAWKAALDKKGELVTSLAKVQSEIEDSEGSIAAVLGEQKSAVYRNDYYFHGCFADESTITREYKKEVSQITRKPFSWKFDWKKHGVVTFSWQFLYPYTTWCGLLCCMLCIMYQCHLFFVSSHLAYHATFICDVHNL